MQSNHLRVVPYIRLNFIFMGILLGGWSTRIPEIKSALHMTDGTLGRCLVGASVAAVLSSRIMGKLIHTLGTKRVFILGVFVFPIGYFLIAYGSSPIFIFFGIFAFAIGYLLLDNPLTIITQDIEAKSDRKYLSGFHAFWSVGTLLAGFFGSFLIGHIKYSYHLTGLAIISFIVLSLSARLLEDKKPEGAEKPAEPIKWFGPLGVIVLLVGIGLMFSNSSEFGATDWSALYLRDVFGIKGSLYVGAYLAFETGMIISRLLGDKYIHKYGAPRVIRFVGITGSAAWLTSMVISLNLHDHHKVIAYIVLLIGYFCAGAGVGPLFPGFITILGGYAGSEMGAALSRAFLIAMLGVAVVPASIGFVSDATSLTYGMLIPIALLCGAGFLGRVGNSKKV